jgi:hypothetical protein
VNSNYWALRKPDLSNTARLHYFAGFLLVFIEKF